MKFSTLHHSLFKSTSGDSPHGSLHLNMASVLWANSGSMAAGALQPQANHVSITAERRSALHLINPLKRQRTLNRLGVSQERVAKTDLSF